MILSHTSSLVFISNPKTATRTIETALSSVQEEPELDSLFERGLYRRRHVPAAVLQRILPARVWDNYFKFAFVRNPWDWFASLHYYSRAKRELPPPRVPFRVDEVCDTYEHCRNSRGVPWCESACQHAYVCDANGRPLVDFVGRFEKLEEHFKHVVLSVGIDSRLSHLNRTSHPHYTTLYSARTRALIGRLYSQDISIFDYAF